MKGDYTKKSEKFKEIARERIDALFKEAQERAKKNVKLSHRYVYLARKISMKYKVRIKPELKRRFCKHCYHYFVLGKNCRVRLREGIKVYCCLDCKKFTRIPYKK